MRRHFQLGNIEIRRQFGKLAAILPDARLQVFAEMGHMGPITHAALVNDAIAAHIGANAGSR